MQHATGQETKTLHRLFGYAPQVFAFEQADAALSALIVDESSMVELRVWGCVANAPSTHTRLILVGDAGQLPPVGPGAVYASLVETPCIPVTRLTTIHRQAADNPLPHVAAAIRHGEVPHLRPWSGESTGVFLLHEPDERRGGEEAVRRATQILLAQGYLMHHVQLLTPRRAGLSGTLQLNAAVRARLSKGTVSPAIPYATGDRVLQTVNDYALGARGIMNGTTGTVVAVGATGIPVDFEGEDVHVTGASLVNLDYGYALTVHRSQGSQYPVVLLPFYGHGGATLLNRHVFYTAITRAEHLVVVLSTPDTLAAAVANKAPAQRVTGFPAHLEEALAAIVSA